MEIPSDVWGFNIFPFLLTPDIVKCTRVCKLWNAIMKDERIQLLLYENVFFVSPETKQMKKFMFDKQKYIKMINMYDLTRSGDIINIYKFIPHIISNCMLNVNYISKYYPETVIKQISYSILAREFYYKNTKQYNFKYIKIDNLHDMYANT
jgi:hypothetical protein